MELSRIVALTALFFILVLILAPAALGADDARERARALAADEAAELKRVEAQDTRRRVRQKDFDRRCAIKPVMTDAEIEACRVAHRRSDT